MRKLGGHTRHTAVQRMRSREQTFEELRVHQAVRSIDVAHRSFLQHHAAVSLHLLGVDEGGKRTEPVRVHPQGEGKLRGRHHGLELHRLEIGACVEMPGAPGLEERLVVGLWSRPGRHQVLDEMGESAAPRGLVEGTGAKRRPDEYVGNPRSGARGR